jgi:hypothetical protein
MRNIIWESGKEEFVKIHFLIYGVIVLLIHVKESNLTCLQAVYATESIGQP